MDMFQESLIGCMKAENKSKAASVCPFTLANQHVKSNKMRDFCLSHNLEHRTRIKAGKEKELRPYEAILSNLVRLPQPFRPTFYRFQELLHFMSKDQPADIVFHEMIQRLEQYVLKSTKVQFQSQSIDLTFVLKEQYGFFEEQCPKKYEPPSFWQETIRNFCLRNLKKPKTQNHIDYYVYESLLAFKSEIQRELHYEKINNSLESIFFPQVAVNYHSAVLEKYEEVLTDIISDSRLALVFQDDVHHHKTYYQYLSEKIVSYYTSSRYFGEIEENVYECHKRSMKEMLQMKNTLKTEKERSKIDPKNGQIKQKCQIFKRQGRKTERPRREILGKQENKLFIAKDSDTPSTRHSSMPSKVTTALTDNHQLPQDPEIAPRLSEIKSVGEDEEDELSQPIDSYMRKKQRLQKQTNLGKKPKYLQPQQHKSDVVLKVTVIGKGPGSKSNNINKEVIYMKNGKEIRTEQQNQRKPISQTHYLDAPPILNNMERKSKKLTHVVSRSKAIAQEKAALKEKVALRISEGIKVSGRQKDLQVRRSNQGTSFIQVKSKKNENDILPYGMLPLVVREDYSYLLYYFGAIDEKELCLKFVMDKIKFGQNILKIVISETELKRSRQKLLKYMAILVSIGCQVIIEVTDNIVEQLYRNHNDIVQAIAYLSRKPFDIVIRNLRKCWRQVEMI